MTSDPLDIRPGAIAAGLVLLALGVCMLLDTTGVTRIPVGRLIGPLVLMAIGAGMVLGRSPLVAMCGRREAGDGRPVHVRRGGPTSGLWLIGVGAWMMASQTHVFGLTFGTSWPILVILSGLMIVIRGTR